MTKYITKLRRTWNRFFIRLSKRLNLTYALGLPYALSIEPTNRCNLKCPLCPAGTNKLKRPRGDMPFENFRRIIDEFDGVLESLLLTNYGEPLLNKDLFRMIAYARKKSIYVQVNTNSFFLSRENVRNIIESDLNNIVIALDGVSEKTYSKYRVGGDFRRVLSNIRLLVGEKRKRASRNPFIQLQFVIMKHNEHEIDKIKEVASDLGVDKLLLKTVGVQTAEEAKEFLPDNPAYRRYDITGGSLVWKCTTTAGLGRCKLPWDSAVINWDGSVSPCCYDMHGEYSLGNVFSDEGFKKVWNNAAYRNFRAKIIKNRRSIPLCSICPGSPGDEDYFLKTAEIPLFEDKK